MEELDLQWIRRNSVCEVEHEGKTFRLSPEDMNISAIGRLFGLESCLLTEVTSKRTFFPTADGTFKVHSGGIYEITGRVPYQASSASTFSYGPSPNSWNIGAGPNSASAPSPAFGAYTSSYYHQNNQQPGSVSGLSSRSSFSPSAGTHVHWQPSAKKRKKTGFSRQILAVKFN